MTADSMTLTRLTQMDSAVNDRRDIKRHGDGKSGAILFVALALFAGFIVWCSLPAFTYSVPPQDEGLLLVYPERILDGQIPSRDFRCSYGPANFYFIAACYKAFGVSVDTERGVGLFYRLLLVTGVGALAGRRGVLVGILAAALTWCMTLPLGLGAYSWFGAVACLVLSLWAASAAPGGATLLQQVVSLGGGLLAAMAVLYRPDLIVVTLLSALPIFIAPNVGRRRAYAIGAGLGVALFVAYVVAASPGAVFGNLINAVRTSGNMRPTKGAPTREETRLLVLLTLAAITTAGIAIYHAAWRRRFSGWRLELSVGLLSLGVLQQVLGYSDLFHIMYAGCVILGLWPMGVSAAIDSGCGKMSFGRQLVVSGMVILTVIGISGKSFLWPAGRTVKVALGLVHYDHFRVVNGGRSLPVASEKERRDMQSLVDEVNAVTSPGDSLVVGPKDLKGTPLGSTYLYFMLPKLKPATYHLEIFPGTTTGPGPGTSFYRDILETRLLILDTRWDNPEASRARTSAQSGDPVTLPAALPLHGQYGPFELYLRRP